MKEPIFLVFGNDHRDVKHVRDLRRVITHYANSHQVVFVEEEHHNSNLDQAIKEKEDNLETIKEILKMLTIRLDESNKLDEFKKRQQDQKYKEIFKSNPVPLSFECSIDFYDTNKELLALLSQTVKKKALYCSPSHKTYELNKKMQETQNNTTEEDGILYDTQMIRNNLYHAMMVSLKRAKTTTTKPILFIIDLGMRHSQTLINILREQGYDYTFGLNSYSTDLNAKYELKSPSKHFSAKPTQHNYTTEEMMCATDQDLIEWAKRKITQCGQQEATRPNRQTNQNKSYMFLYLLTAIVALGAVLVAAMQSGFVGRQQDSPDHGSGGPTIF